MTKVKFALLGLGLALGLSSAQARIPAPCDCQGWLTELNRCEAGQSTNVSDCRFYYDGWRDCQTDPYCESRF
ncbi:hypothetical protein [Ferrimonas aestuarii]|uniref:DUF3551 domain-containing protein n=1 Tax=Ferrimonas aestuarii TaxID=2569539 RepID=A0A4U1BIE8_9GAMM|nr:hypothetical protein [Ferrimonas aestuarii]TKB50896.1 hypothetical protein FCL42_18030 [Ferrimonas aestuarii]